MQQQSQQSPQQGQTPQTPATSLEVIFGDSPSYQPFRATIDASPQSTSMVPERFTPPASTGGDTDMPPSSSRKRTSQPLSSTGKKPVASPATSETESIRLPSHSANYVGSIHWAAVLDSISELKDHYEQEEEARMLAADDYVSDNSPGPRLLYEPVQATRADILAFMPARTVVDRMIALYFNVQNNASLPILHSGRFLGEVRYFLLLFLPIYRPFSSSLRGISPFAPSLLLHVCPLIWWLTFLDSMRSSGRTPIRRPYCGLASCSALWPSRHVFSTL